MIIIISGIIVAFVSGFFCAMIAKRKNMNAVLWFFVGFLFPLLSLIAIAGMPVTNAESDKDAEQNNPTKKCPKCAEIIKLEVKVCRYCQYEFPAEEVEKLVEKHKVAKREKELEEKYKFYN